MGSDPFSRPMTHRDGETLFLAFRPPKDHSLRIQPGSWDSLPTLPCSMKKVLGLNLFGSNPSSSSHTSFSWAWLPCKGESQGLMSKKSGYYRIKLENPLSPSHK